MTADQPVVVRGAALDSPARSQPATREPLRIAVVQDRWHGDAQTQADVLEQSVRIAAGEGARLVVLQELTLSPYFATDPAAGDGRAEDIPDGPTSRWAIRLARETGAHVHASLFERSPDAGGLGFDTAIVASPGGEIVARTRKLHIPGGAGYHEDRYFRPGAPGADAFDVVALEGAAFGFPTCYDQWFPELARVYSLRGAEVIVYPSAIGSEPDHPGFDTEPQWESVITANGIMNGTFMVVANRIGTEGGVTFYGSSFVSDPYGRKIVQAPRDRAAVLIADLDLDQRRDWLELFPLLRGRRPDAYSDLV
ncbi:MAG TPA: nitrilase-related carbon-nitrogen hydrolase [Candidatus Dormibacteraeota bacterium]|nr:nitrilase-related carbon-nitrogen hydrolase [Candidatus Dormibacteraeota bacterium]